MRKMPEKMDLAEYLYVETKVMCIIRLNNLEVLKHKIFYFEESWAKRCNKVMYAFVSSKKFAPKELDTGRKDRKIEMFSNQIEVFKHVQKSEYFNDVDWFLYTNENR